MHFISAFYPVVCWYWLVYIFLFHYFTTTVLFLNVISIPDILLTQRRRKRFDVFNQCMGLPWMVDHWGGKWLHSRFMFYSVFSYVGVGISFCRACFGTTKYCHAWLRNVVWFLNYWLEIGLLVIGEDWNFFGAVLQQSWLSVFAWDWHTRR